MKEEKQSIFDLLLVYFISGIICLFFCFLVTVLAHIILPLGDYNFLGYFSLTILILVAMFFPYIVGKIYPKNKLVEIMGLNKKDIIKESLSSKKRVIFLSANFFGFILGILAIMALIAGANSLTIIGLLASSLIISRVSRRIVFVQN